MNHWCKWLQWAVWAALLFCMLSCASTGSPTGGPKDILPPVLDTARSSRTGQVFFKPRELSFFFDEFVEVKDAIKQVLVSPPLTYIPKVAHRGKKVSFQFDEKEVLKDDATYTINFGESVVDYHEGNVLSPFTFVFATGANLDSLTIEGRIIQAKTGETEKEMVVFLYDNLADSIVRKEKPLYFARPDKEGVFRFLNIKSDTFRILAIKDENLNYRYDLETEKIAFADSLIFLTASRISPLLLRSSLPEPKLRLLAANTRQYGKINLLYNTRPPDTLRVSLSDKSIPFAAESILDSVNVYYETTLDSFYAYIGLDTLKIKPRGRGDFLKKSKFTLQFTSPLSNISTRDSVTLSFSQPLGRFAAEDFQVSDSLGLLRNLPWKISRDQKTLTLSYRWAAGGKYKIFLPKQKFQSIYGMWNDSLNLAVSILPADKTAGLKVIVEGMDSTAHYMITLWREQTLISRSFVKRLTTQTLSLKGLAPDKYQVEVVRDINQNGRWDAGNYWSKTQPEPYYLFKGDKLRENWDSEMKVSVSGDQKPADEPNRQSTGLPLNNPLQPRKK